MIVKKNILHSNKITSPTKFGFGAIASKKYI